MPNRWALGKDISKKNIESLPSAVSGALSKVFSKKKNLCRVPNSRHSVKKDAAEYRYAWQPMPSAELLPRVWHSAKKSFAECTFLPSAWHSAKNSLPSVILCRVRHSAKNVFAECPIFYTRQRILHSAKSLFPVVYVTFDRVLKKDSDIQDRSTDLVEHIWNQLDYM